MNKKTIGIIGSGQHFNKKIFPILSNSNFFQIKGVLRKKKITFKNIKNFNEKDFFNQHFDFIYIACPNKFHEKYIIKSLIAKSHVICEKPFILRKKNINKIIKLSQDNKKLIFEAFMYVYHPVFNYVNKLIRSKKYGKIRYVIANFRYPSLTRSNNRYKKDEGDGFFYDAASYLISLENFLFKNKNSKILKSYSQKIKNAVDLRGNIYINSSKGNRFYFWGEGQKYSNNLEIFFDKASVYVDKFFSKNDREEIKIKIYGKNIKEKVIKEANHFEKMFSVIQKKYNRKNFKKSHINSIKNQLDLLLKYNN